MAKIITHTVRGGSKDADDKKKNKPGAGNQKRPGKKK